MAKLLLLVALVAMVLLVEGGKLNVNDKLNLKEKLNFKKFMNRKDPFPEPSNPPKPQNVVEGTITQRLDNFDPTNRATWQQRYLMNGEHFRPGGCIFVFLAGEWPITPYRLENSFMENMSQDISCYMFYLEHRYYGESRPTADISDENLRFLTVEQALADTAHFITHIKLESVTPGASNSPVIVIGGHYSASLAIWFRQAYPHLVVGAWASSAPVNAQLDHFQYKELSGAVYRHIGGNACYERIERGFAEMEQMVADNRVNDLTEMFQICNTFDSPQDITLFFSSVSEFYSLLAQFDQVVNIAGVCELILDESIESDAEGVAALLVELLDGECVEIDYEDVIEEDRNPSWDGAAGQIGVRQWSYQSCTQLGWYHSALSRFQPYGSSFQADFRLQACEDVFGETFDSEEFLENVDRFNTIYGGLNPEPTNVLFVHGQLDPWRSIGVQTTNRESAPALIIQGASQGNDLGPISEEDTPAVLDAKYEIQATIYRWIREAQGIEIIPL